MVLTAPVERRRFRCEDVDTMSQAATVLACPSPEKADFDEMPGRMQNTGSGNFDMERCVLRRITVWLSRQMVRPVGLSNREEDEMGQELLSV